MKRIKRAAFLLLFFASSAFGAFSEFYCIGLTGSNLNAGSTTSAIPLATYVSDAVLGWSATTGVFGVLVGDPVADGVTVGMFASVYVTVGATNATFVSRITGVTTSSITVSLTAVSGTPPATDLILGGRTLKVGGAWAGMSGANKFPFGFAATAMKNVAGDTYRVNIKSGTTYAITFIMQHSLAGPGRFQGYTTTPGDLGRATIDGGTAAGSYVLLEVSGANNDIVDLIFRNNGSSVAAHGVTSLAAENNFVRCVINSVRGDGIAFSTSGGGSATECEVYGANQSATADGAGFSATVGILLNRCISHDNAGSTTHGFKMTGGVTGTFSRCLSESNGGKGFYTTNTIGLTVLNCDASNNGGDGLDIGATSAVNVLVESSNFLKNGGYGINSSGSATLRNGAITNCAFGSGTQVNTSGDILTTLTGINVMNKITYPADVTPWVDPANGDFRVVLAQAKGTGRGAFTQTASGYAGTVSYPDIGASQGSSVQTGSFHIPSIGE